MKVGNSCCLRCVRFCCQQSFKQQIDNKLLNGTPSYLPAYLSTYICASFPYLAVPYFTQLLLYFQSSFLLTVHFISFCFSLNSENLLLLFISTTAPTALYCTASHCIVHRTLYIVHYRHKEHGRTARALRQGIAP